MTDNNIDGPRGSGKWIKVLLGVSLALNLVVVGAFAGAAVRHDGLPDRTKRSPALAAFGAPYMKALPRSQRREVMSIVRADRTASVPDRRARRALFQEVLTQLRATPFDPDALQEITMRQAATAVSLQGAVQTAWVQVVVNMTDAERQAYAQAVENELRKRPKRK